MILPESVCGRDPAAYSSLALASCPDLSTIETSHGDDFGSCAGQKTFVRREDVVTCQNALLNGDASRDRQLHDSPASDPFKDAGVRLWRPQDNLASR